jgi:3-oxoacyl-(acyl-carrier-protein) synthase
VAIVIERASAARARGAKALAKVAGLGLASSIKPEGNAEAIHRAAVDALRESKATVSDVDLIVGTGRGLPAYDTAERKALGRLMEARTTACPVTAIASRTGVPEAASGLLAVVAGLKAMSGGEAPAMLAAPPSSAFPLEWISETPRIGRYSKVLVVGGTDAGNCASVLLDTAQGVES